MKQVNADKDKVLVLYILSVFICVQLRLKEFFLHALRHRNPKSKIQNLKSLALLLCFAAQLAFSGEKVELQYWTNPFEMRAMAEVFEQYQQDNPHVKVSRD